MGIQRVKLRLSDLVFIAVLFIALASGQQMLGIDSDLGRHLTLGNYILDERVIPTRDLLSHTRAGFSRPPYEWLSQVILALSDRLLGLNGVILLTALVIALSFTLLYQYANRRSGSPILALILVLVAAAASSIHWLPRPHIFTFLLLAVWLELLDQHVEGKPVKPYLFPVIMLLWANLHGGFVFGILAWTAYLGGWCWETLRGKINRQTGKNLLVTGITSIIATVVTPGLWRNWEAVLNNRSVFILNRTVETMRPNLADPFVLPFTLLLALTILILAIHWKTLKALKASHLFLLGGLGGMALLMARNIPLYAIACTPILAEMGGKTLSRFKTWTQVEERFAGFGSRPGQSVGQIAVALLAVAYFFSYFNFKHDHSIYQFDPGIFPVEAVNFLQTNPQSGNMFNEFNWGGYLQYRLWPAYPVFLDSQSDFYGEDLMREYDQVMSANGDWQGVLEKYRVNWAIIPSHSALSTELARHPGWETIYKDKTAMVFRRLLPSFR